MQFLILLFVLLIGKEPFSISAVFADKHYIPARFSCIGENVNPELKIRGIPKNTVSLALIMEDPDKAFGTFDHWVMWNIPVQSKIEENTAPGIVGRNSHKENKYTGPCPPSGVHEYHFKLYALDTKLNLSDTTGKLTLLKAFNGHVIAETELIGLYYSK